MDLSNLKLLNMPIPRFAATQVGIGIGRGIGYTQADIIQLGAEHAAKSFVQNGQLKPFAEGAKHLAGRMSDFIKRRPSYVAAGALGSAGFVKAWNELSKPFYPKPTSKLSLGQRFKKGFDSDIGKISRVIFDHPVATIAGIAGAVALSKHLNQKNDDTNNPNDNGRVR